jgi:beta-barrel assembly-enhancing protease
MEQTFQGKYFNGLSSKPLDAFIALDEEAILIAYTDKDGESQTVAWDIAQMQKNEFIGKDRVTLLYGSFPPQSLEVVSADFVREIKAKYASKAFMQSHYHFLANKGLKGVMLGITICIALVGLFYFFGVPAIAERVAEKFPIEYEEQLGGQLFDALTTEYTKDSAKTELANQFFKALKYPSQYNIKITVVDFSMVNAFAVPGGNIVVFTGILDKMKSETELAALLAHEASHVELRHSTKSIFRSLASYLFISLIFYDVNAIASILIDNANMLTNLHYSRNLEQEADENGFDLMVAQNIDPQGMVALFETLKEEEGESPLKLPNTGQEEVSEKAEKQANAEDSMRIILDFPEEDTSTEIPENEETTKKDKDKKTSSEPTEFMSSHPLLANRISYIKEKIASQKYTVKENKTLKDIWEKIKSENQ